MFPGRCVKSGMSEARKEKRGEKCTLLELGEGCRGWEGSPPRVEGGQGSLVMLNLQTGSSPGLSEGFNDTLYIHHCDSQEDNWKEDLYILQVNKESGIYIKCKSWSISLILTFIMANLRKSQHF